MINPIKVDDARFELLNTTTVESKGKILTVPSRNNTLEDLVDSIGKNDIAELAIRMITTDVRNKSNAKPTKEAESKEAFESVTKEQLDAVAGDWKAYQKLLQRVKIGKAELLRAKKAETESIDTEEVDTEILENED